MPRKNILVACFLALIFFTKIISANAEEQKKEQRDFFVNLSVDNQPKAFMDIGTNVAFSALSVSAYLGNEYNVDEYILGRAAFAYLSYILYLSSHEISGHAARIYEFGGKVDSVEVDLLELDGVTRTKSKLGHLNKSVLLNTGGLESSYLLSQKILDNWVVKDQKIHPLMSFGYIFTRIDQIDYVYDSNIVGKSSNDISNYIKNTNAIYGNNSITLGKIKKLALLDILDPVLYASLYSGIIGTDVEIPKITFGHFGFSPFAKLILAPYGIMEKQFGTYIFTDYTPIKISFRFGNQSKGNQANKDTIKKSDIVNEKGPFRGLKPGESIKNNSSYGVDLSIFKILEIDNITLGADTSIWKQPEIFVNDPYRAKPKFGWMAMLNASYKMNDTFAIKASAGYKTKGFIPGIYINKTPIIKVGFEAKL